jgi:hypothetical protein
VGYFPANPLPYLDCCVTVLILTAQTLSALKKWDCWIAWLFVNIANLTLYLKAGLVFMPIVSCLYLGNGIWSVLIPEGNDTVNFYNNKYTASDLPGQDNCYVGGKLLTGVEDADFQMEFTRDIVFVPGGKVKYERYPEQDGEIKSRVSGQRRIQK